LAARADGFRHGGRAIRGQHPDTGRIADERPHTLEDGPSDGRRKGVSRCAVEVSGKASGAVGMRRAESARVFLHGFGGPGQEEESSRVRYRFKGNTGKNACASGSMSFTVN